MNFIDFLDYFFKEKMLNKKINQNVSRLKKGISKNKLIENSIIINNINKNFFSLLSQHNKKLHRHNYIFYNSYDNLVKFQRKYLFKKIEFPKNNYQILGVSYDADFEDIKKAYYALAKKYHPDINPDPQSLEKFKEIKKAYEILGDPNMRISYDIENKFSNPNSNSRSESDNRYTQRYGKRVMKGPRTIKNFYFDKWSEFKIPKWSNLRTGMDYKSEYIFRDTDEDLDLSHRTNWFIKKLKKYRFVFYFLMLFSLDIFLFIDNIGLYLNYRLIKKTFFEKTN